MRGLRVVLAMLVGACIGVSVVVMFLRHRFGWPASVPGMVVPACAAIAIAAVVKWRRLDFDIAQAVERAIAGLSRSHGFEASIRRSFTMGATAITMLLIVVVLRARDANVHAYGVVALALVACGLMVFSWALKPGATLVIDTHGLQHAKFGRIPWESIVGLQYVESESGVDPPYVGRSLHLAIESPRRFAHQLHWSTRLRRPSLASPATRFGELEISLNALDEPHEVIVAAAYEFRGRVDAPFAIGWEPAMAPRELAALLAMEDDA